MNGRTRFRIAAAATATALALAGCATSPSSGYSSYPQSTYGGSTANCYDCGTVTRVEQVTSGSSAPGATGAVLGGIVGAVAGHEISRHTGGSEGNQNVSAAVGAVGGAVAGNAIQKNTSASYNVYVRMNDGRTTVVTQTDLDGIRQGSYVRVYNGRAWAQ
ncbi:glycine zipper 2TM domain-containing protein [Lysobacter niastensis]|uniref:Glycine zipper 2TM domain-containing protein n=1 Tax=Lysobacter niastensis TaxID=380629 RepID=A0ABS0B6Q1_9GAMM|nr:glycine zipper 2TM domain-containing protein [Lysobacter niastensis]MBF6024700.1 glycine zipper 2TM domain-containing protein [Lysobacter niastensis]